MLRHDSINFLKNQQYIPYCLHLKLFSLVIVFNLINAAQNSRWNGHPSRQDSDETAPSYLGLYFLPSIHVTKLLLVLF